ncbi:MAG: hypothetical protein HZB76_06980 [Chlamydiae bacterium]|nr:hypothetical protein [Chlamydiota bacterium]
MSSLILSSKLEQKIIENQDFIKNALCISSYILIGTGALIGGIVALSPLIPFVVIALEISAVAAFIFSGWGLLAIVGAIIAGALLVGAGMKFFDWKQDFEKYISTTKTIEVVDKTPFNAPKIV